MKTYIRRTNPSEVVEVLEHENALAGKIWYHAIEPKMVATKRCLAADRFFLLYEPVDQYTKPIRRPDVEGTKEEWRTYALHLERIYGNKAA